MTPTPPATTTRFADRLRGAGFWVYLAAAVGATLAVWFALDLWAMRWDVPLGYSGDSLAVAAHFKTIIETGWYEVQPALGAPFGQNYNDYPTADNLHFAVALVLGAFTGDWAIAMNVHFVLGFPLAALAMVWFLRRVGASSIVTVVVAIIFAIAPYHFSRGEGHLFLSWYWVVPLALGLVYSMLRGESVWGRRHGVPRGLGHMLGRTGGTVSILLLLGSASAYYATFTLILGGLAAIAALWLGRNWRRFWSAIAAAAVLVAVILANMAPDVVYRLANGSNAGAFQRTPVESEIYALKLAQLLLPPAWHRFEPFAFLRGQYDVHYPLPSEGPALGLVAAGGFIALIVAIFFTLAAVVARRPFLPDGIPSRLAPLGFLTLAAFLFAMVGGLSTLISFVSTSLRAWNRISIVIAALSLAAIAILLDALIHRLAATRALRRVAMPVVALIVAVPVSALGVWDQTPAADPTARSVTVAVFESDADFTQRIEQRLPASAMLFQLPYVDFPESPPVGRALDSDQLRPYLHSTDLRFSGGGIRGRADIDGLKELGELPVEEFLKVARERGYAGVIVDTYAFDDATEGDDLASSLEDHLGGSGLVSLDGRFQFFTLEG